MNRISWLFLTLLFTGCATPVRWVADTQTNGEAVKQLATCELQMEESVSPEMSGEARSGRVKKLTALCMKANGYKAEIQ